MHIGFGRSVVYSVGDDPIGVYVRMNKDAGKAEGRMYVRLTTSDNTNKSGSSRHLSNRNLRGSRRAAPWRAHDRIVTRWFISDSDAVVALRVATRRGRIQDRRGSPPGGASAPSPGRAASGGSDRHRDRRWSRRRSRQPIRQQCPPGAVRCKQPAPGAVRSPHPQTGDDTIQSALRGGSTRAREGRARSLLEGGRE